MKPLSALLTKPLYKILLGGGALLSTITYASAQTSGFFVGALVGAMAPNNNFSYSYENAQVWGNENGSWTNSNFISSGNAKQNTFSTNLNYGVRLGYVLALNNYNAFRLYGKYSAGQYAIGTDISGAQYQGVQQESFFAHQLGAGIDYMLSFSAKSNAWGLFVGGGYEYWLGEVYDNLKNLQSISYETSLNNHFPYVNIGLTKAFGSGMVSVEIGYRHYFNTMYSGKFDTTSWREQAHSELRGDIKTDYTAKPSMSFYAALNVKF